MEALKVLQKLFEVRDQIHFLHLNTQSHSEHKALNEFYDNWLDLADSFIETYQGKYGRIQGDAQINISTTIEVNIYLVALSEFLNKDIVTLIDITIDSDLDNIIADLKGLVNHTRYLLTLK